MSLSWKEDKGHKASFLPIGFFIAKSLRIKWLMDIAEDWKGSACFISVAC